MVESVKNETYLLHALKTREFLSITGHGVHEGKFGATAYSCAKGTLYNDNQIERHHFLMCTEELSAPQARHRWSIVTGKGHLSLIGTKVDHSIASGFLSETHVLYRIIYHCYPPSSAPM